MLAPENNVSKKIKAEKKRRRTAEEKEPPKRHSGVVKDIHGTTNEMIPTTKLSGQRSSLLNTNKQRCLLVGTRLMSARERALMHDFCNLIPHGTLSNKVTVPYGVSTLMKELVILHNCNTCLTMRAKKKQTILWISQGIDGPSASFALANIFQASAFRFSGNCLKYSRPLLHFDSEFEKVPHLRAMRTLFNMVFGTPRNHPKSKPFVDHIYCFFYYDGVIWFRNYQISVQEKENTEFIEIGPRFTLSPLALLDGFFQGECIWKNSNPRKIDRLADLRSAKAAQYIARKEAKLRRQNREKEFPYQPQREDLLFS